MTITYPESPLFAHSKNIIEVQNVDTYVDVVFIVKTKNTSKTYEPTRFYAYNNKLTIDISFVCKLFYYNTDQPNTVLSEQLLNGENNLNGGELTINITDKSLTVSELKFNVINAALQETEHFDKNTSQWLNQIHLQFKGFPNDVTQYRSDLKHAIRTNINSFPQVKKCKGVYVKWLNKYGAYEYFVFDGYPEIEINAFDIETFKSYSLGKKSYRTIKIKANIIEGNELYNILKFSIHSNAKKITEALMAIVESPEIYVFLWKDSHLGGMGSFNFDFDNSFEVNNPDFIAEGNFVKVAKITSTNKMNFKFNTTPLTFELILPEEYNITAI